MKNVGSHRRWSMQSKNYLCVLCMLLCSCVAFAASPQSAATHEPLKLLKVDPPSWFARFPEPMLLVRGEGLTGAEFSLSDPALHIARQYLSSNGHWALLWLTASPQHAETVQLKARSAGRYAKLLYTFAEPKLGDAGFAGFSNQDSMYLIMTDRFADGDLTNDGPHATDLASSPEAGAERAKARGWHGGDLRGITQHLDYIQKLGFDTVWITPVYQNHNPMAYHGYGATDMYAVDEHYGTLADLHALVDGLHARGMKFVLDTVPNHIGPEHPWVHDPPTPQWFHGTAEHHSRAEGNFATLVDPHAPERDRDDVLHGWFANVLPDMNTDDPAVSTYLRQNAVWWIETLGIDGLRLDTFPYVNREFWRDFHAQLHGLFPPLTTVGEIFNRDPVLVSFFAGGATHAGVDSGLDTPFDFPTYHVLRDVFLSGHAMTELRDVLARDVLYPHPERLVPFLGNHDNSRFRTEASSEAAMRLAFGFLLTTRGMPQIYSGDELAMRGGDDPDNRRDFSGGFPGQTANAFKDTGLDSEAADMKQWVSKLLHLRQAHPALRCGGEQVLFAERDTLVTIRDSAEGCPRGALHDRVVTVLQRGVPTKPISFGTRDTWLEGCTHVQSIAGAHPSLNFAEGTFSFMPPPDSVSIWSCSNQ